MNFMGGRVERWDQISEELKGEVSGDKYYNTLYEILKD